ncbi:MAG: glycosyltransferase family 9 protein [Myxococcales bacterium]|nr:glycosyltransferase family 9 protein [Myxococcales bacterium]MCB9645464.1 glycosyltransferase family 9 protein [Deltaproteobacteria bacterium]
MERVLLIRVSALGDVVLTQPAVRALRAAHPGIRVDLVTDPRYAELATVHLGYDRAVPFERHNEDAAAVVARLPETSYDAVVDLQGKLRTRALARRVPAQRRLRLQKRSFGRALLSVVGYDPPLVDRRAAQLYLDVLAPLGVPGDAPLALRLEGAPPPGPGLRIGLSPCATHATKRWSPERFGALADALVEAHPEAELVLIGGPGDREVLAAVRAAARAPLSPEDVTGLPVPELARVVGGLHLMISVDTGPAHLAAGFGVPTAVIFGPTAPERWGPVGPPHQVVRRKLDCMPCSNTGGDACPRTDRNHACLRELEVGQVLAAAEAALAGGAR